MNIIRISQISLNIERSAMQEMRTSEASHSFDYDPNWTPSAHNELNVVSIGIQPVAAEFSTLPPPIVKRKNSLDDFELEIDGMNLDDNIDTSVSLLLATFIQINSNLCLKKRT